MLTLGRWAKSPETSIVIFPPNSSRQSTPTSPRPPIPDLLRTTFEPTASSDAYLPRKIAAWPKLLSRVRAAVVAQKRVHFPLMLGTTRKVPTTRPLLPKPKHILMEPPISDQPLQPLRPLRMFVAHLLHLDADQRVAHRRRHELAVAAQID